MCLTGLQQRVSSSGRLIECSFHTKKRSAVLHRVANIVDVVVVHFNCIFISFASNYRRFVCKFISSSCVR